MKKLTLLLLSLSMLLLCGCDPQGRKDPTPTESPVPTAAPPMDTDPVVKDGLAPVGTVDIPFPEDIKRGQYARIETTIDPDAEDAMLVIPVSILDTNTMLACPVIVNDTGTSVLVYRDEQGAYHASLNISPTCMFTRNGYFRQIEYNASESYIACDGCGVVYPLEAIGCRNEFAHDCHPYTLSESAFVIASADGYEIDRLMFSGVPENFGDNPGDCVMAIPFDSLAAEFYNAVSLTTDNIPAPAPAESFPTNEGTPSQEVLSV